MVVLRISVDGSAETVRAAFADFSLVDDPDLLRVKRRLVLHDSADAIHLVEIDGRNWLIKNFQAFHAVFNWCFYCLLVVQLAKSIVGLLTFYARNQNLIVCCKTFGTQNNILIK